MCARACVLRVAYVRPLRARVKMGSCNNTIMRSLSKKKDEENLNKSPVREMHVKWAVQGKRSRDQVINGDDDWAATSTLRKRRANMVCKRTPSGTKIINSKDSYKTLNGDTCCQSQLS